MAWPKQFQSSSHILHAPVPQAGCLPFAEVGYAEVALPIRSPSSEAREHQGCIWIGSGSFLMMVPVFQTFPLELADQQGAQHWAPGGVASKLVGVLDLLACRSFVPSALTTSAVSMPGCGGGCTGIGEWLRGADLNVGHTGQR